MIPLETSNLIAIDYHIMKNILQELINFFAFTN